MFVLPLFVRRLLALRRARRAARAGRATEALAILREPACALSRSAHELRQMLLESATLEAGRALAAGDELALRRALEIVASEDPARALEWQRRFGSLARAARDAAAVEEPPLLRLLGEMRARQRVVDLGPLAGAPAPAAHDRGASPPVELARRTAPVSAEERARARAGSANLRFHFEVDDGGEFLAVSGAVLVLGHLRSTRADLPFLADVDAEHARLLRRDAFHAGPSWQIERCSARDVRVNGRAIDAQPCGLHDGDEVELARNLSFRFRQPEASSQSAILELARGSECEGAQKILLFAPGEAGVVRIGRKRQRHVCIADLEHEIALKLVDRELWVHCDGGVRVVAAAHAGDASPNDAASSTGIVPCPPHEPRHLVVGARPQKRAPMGISLRPALPAPTSPPEDA